ncbi:MAG: hypothetical protein AAGB06_05570 [Verrucomicrobiota bacterium]
MRLITVFLLALLFTSYSVGQDTPTLIPDDPTGLDTPTDGPPDLDTETLTPPSDDLISEAPNIGDKLQAIATRALVESGEGVLTNGFIIEGSGEKTVVIAAKGPSFQSADVPNTLQDPFLRLYQFNTSTNTFEEIESNDDWETGLSDADRAVLDANNFTFSNSLESVIVRSLPAGAYTAQVEGKTTNGVADEGVGLAEVYDFDTASVSKITALATRVFAGTGADSLNGGFIIAGDSVRTVAIRASGPSLSSFVSNPLADPFLAVNRYNTTTLQFEPVLLNGTPATNDNWETGLSGADRTLLETNNFTPTNSLESILVLDLEPGAYTGVITGADNGTGIALIEVYDYTTE